MTHGPTTTGLPPEKRERVPLPAGVRTFRIPRHTRKTPDRPCLNCGDRTVGFFCPQCGQRKVEVRASLRRMLMEALDDQFSLNSALPRTLTSLLFRPGHLTREYLEGRIVRYIPPFRLYLVSSVIFFLVLSFMPEVRTTLAGGNPLRASAAADSAAIFRVGADTATTAADVLPERAPTTGSAMVDSAIAHRMEEMRGMSPREASATMLEAFLEHVPQMMFLLLPVFALILAGLYARGNRFYVEHFVFALHVHAFAYLTFTVALLLRNNALTSVLTLWQMLYVYLALKRVYGQGWWRTGVKYWTLGGIYFVVGLAAALLTFFVSVLLG